MGNLQSKLTFNLMCRHVLVRPPTRISPRQSGHRLRGRKAVLRV